MGAIKLLTLNKMKCIIFTVMNYFCQANSLGALKGYEALYRLLGNLSILIFLWR